MFVMFKNFFNRTKPTAPTSPESAVQASVKPVAPQAIPAAPKDRLNAFREEWDDRQDNSLDVIEGNGGNTDWAAFTDAVKDEDQAFAPTTQIPLSK